MNSRGKNKIKEKKLKGGKKNWGKLHKKGEKGLKMGYKLKKFRLGKKLISKEGKGGGNEQ